MSSSASSTADLTISEFSQLKKCWVQPAIDNPPRSNVWFSPLLEQGVLAALLFSDALGDDDVPLLSYVLPDSSGALKDVIFEIAAHLSRAMLNPESATFPVLDAWGLQMPVERKFLRASVNHGESQLCEVFIYPSVVETAVQRLCICACTEYKGKEISQLDGAKLKVCIDSSFQHEQDTPNTIKCALQKTETIIRDNFPVKCMITPSAPSRDGMTSSSAGELRKGGREYRVIPATALPPATVTVDAAGSGSAAALALKQTVEGVESGP
eukprot:g1827.t1